MWFGSSMIVWVSRCAFPNMIKHQVVIALQWINPTSQVGGFFGSQIVPGTPHVIELNAAFEKAVYDTLKQEA